MPSRGAGGTGATLVADAVQWASLGGRVSNPVVASDGHRLHVFTRGLDGAVWHIAQTAPHLWGEWRSLGGAVAGRIAVGNTKDGRLEVPGCCAARRTPGARAPGGVRGRGGRHADPQLADGGRRRLERLIRVSRTRFPRGSARGRPSPPAASILESAAGAGHLEGRAEIIHRGQDRDPGLPGADRGDAS